MKKWHVKRTAPGEYECRFGTALRAVIRYRSGSGRPWMVHRITLRRDGTHLEGGGEGFRSLTEARTFVIDNPAVWGV